MISMCLMMNATTGGTDFISIYLSEKTGMDSFNIILGFNAVLLVGGAAVWLGEGTVFHHFPVCLHTGSAHLVQTVPPAHALGGDKSCKADL